MTCDAQVKQPLLPWVLVAALLLTCAGCLLAGFGLGYQRGYAQGAWDKTANPIWRMP